MPDSSQPASDDARAAAVAQAKAALLGIPTLLEYAEHYQSAYFGSRSDDPSIRTEAEIALEAMESRELVVTTYDALTAMISDIVKQLRINRGLRNGHPQKKSADWERRAGRLETIFGTARAGLRDLKDEVDAERRRANAPNPLQRAKDRLWQLALAGDVPAGTASRLLAEEKDKVAERRRAAKLARKEASRLERGADRPPAAERPGRTPGRH